MITSSSTPPPEALTPLLARVPLVPIQVTVGMYDAFTTVPLTVLDDRLLLQGQAEEPVILVVE